MDPNFFGPKILLALKFLWTLNSDLTRSLTPAQPSLFSLVQKGKKIDLVGVSIYNIHLRATSLSNSQDFNTNELDPRQHFLNMFVHHTSQLVPGTPGNCRGSPLEVQSYERYCHHCSVYCHHCSVAPGSNYITQQSKILNINMNHNHW